MPEERLARRIGLFDSTMVVMGGIVGSGIFVTPAIVASWTSTREEMIGAWIAGGGAALLGAFIYAGLSRRRPFAGGQYVYLREAYHPAVGFMYGWALLLVIQTGGMAVCAMTFGRYFRQLAGTYEVLLRYVVAIDFIFFALVASCLFVFQARGEPISMPGHPLTTLLFIGGCAAVVISTFARDPVHALIGLALTLAGLPVYLLWRRTRLER